jgi:fluoride ion exporter CrcB/FEX
VAYQALVFAVQGNHEDMAIRFGMAGCLDTFSTLRLAQFVELRQNCAA